MTLLHFIEAFHVEVAKMLDETYSAGEAGGLMEWANGRWKNYELYFLWFPKTKKLVYVVRGPHTYDEGIYEAKSAVDAIAAVERLLQRLKQ